MSDVYEREFLLLCDFLAERLELTAKMVQENVATVGLRAVRRLLKDVNIHSSSDGIEWDSVTDLRYDEDWLQYRIEAAWKMIMKISKGIQER